MKIDIIADKPLGTYYLKNLKDEVVHFNNSEIFDLAPGWYNFILEYSGNKIDISDIKVNGDTLRHYLYTGFFTEKSTGKQFQPANAVWTEGFYSIWIHTEPGLMEIAFMQSIRNGDHGLDKFPLYLHTVDKHIDIDPLYPERIQTYFRAAHGPAWWRKGTLNTPYDVVLTEQTANIDREKIIHDIKLDCKLVIDKDISGFGKQDGTQRFLKRKCMTKYSHFPFVEVEDLKNTELAKLCQQIGMTRLLEINLQTLPAGGSFRPHIDDEYYKDPYKINEANDYLKGPSIFMFNLQAQGSKEQKFKLGPAGLLPINDGVFFNQQVYSHCSINNSNYDRPMLILHGDRNITYN